MNTDRIWFRKSPSRRSHHQCGSHAQQQRWKHRGWYWSPRIGSRVHSGCSTDLGIVKRFTFSTLMGVLSTPSIFFRPTWWWLVKWGNEMFSYYTWLSRSGCRRETALPPALYPHLIQKCSLSLQPTIALVLTSRSGQLGHSCRPLPSPPCPDQQECSRCSRGRT